jgi:hypothetical protein
MNRQAHISSFPPFQPAPLPRNEADVHFLQVIVVVVWVVGMGLMLWTGRGSNRKQAREMHRLEYVYRA